MLLTTSNSSLFQASKQPASVRIASQLPRAWWTAGIMDDGRDRVANSNRQAHNVTESQARHTPSPKPGPGTGVLCLL